MGDELTGVTLGGFGGRRPPPPPPSLHWPSLAPHAAAVAAGSGARTQLGVFENKFPPQLLLITVIIVIIGGLRRPVWGPRARPDNEDAAIPNAAAAKPSLKDVIIGNGRYISPPPPPPPPLACLKVSEDLDPLEFVAAGAAGGVGIAEESRARRSAGVGQRPRLFGEETGSPAPPQGWWWRGGVSQQANRGPSER